MTTTASTTATAASPVRSRRRRRVAAVAFGLVALGGVAGMSHDAGAYTGRITKADLIDAGASPTAGNGWALNGRVYHCVGSANCTW